MGLGQFQQGQIPLRIGRHSGLRDRRPRDRDDDGCGVGVFVGVDADDDVDDLCQHGHAFISYLRRDVVGPVREETAGL
jgi:hypothetical protein